jgi:hypothetical protein
MRYVLALLFLFSPVMFCRAADVAKPNPLTPKEIADGWLLLFDGESTFGWQATNNSQWTITGGMLAPQAKTTGALVTTTAFNDYELSLEYQAQKEGSPQVMVTRRMDVKPVQMKPGEDSPSSPLAGPNGEHILPLRATGIGWNRLNLRISGAKIVASASVGALTTVQFKTAPGASSPGSSHIALAGNGFVVRNVKLRPLGAQPLFNGKDLTGWKEFPGRKSKFTVTPEGWLSIKNGNGDLQSTGQWADFVLQLECRTNGDNLNSGVFFRCQPDQYQQGYEAQIHNGHAKMPKTYTIEEYDPQTHELRSKKKIESWASDYGTGSIYRRVPARRAAAKDREWFTMTVVAQGRHIATWVNGIQTADWTDNRPEKDNARNGCRLEKGPISLQGHDPTTDLTFRNIRIAGLNERK